MKLKNALVILSLILLLNGCWDARELNDLDIVLGMAVDKGQQNDIVLTLQTAKTSSSAQEEKGGSEKAIITSSLGKTYFEAARNITLHLPRRNFWPHTQTVVISEDIAKNGIESLVDFFVRDSQRRTSVYFIVSEGKSKEILAQPPSTESLSALEIKKLITQTTSSGLGVDLNLRNFIQNTQSFTGVSLLNKIKIKKEEDNEKSQNSGSLTLAGTAVFVNYQLKGYLSPLETKASNWLRNELKTGTLTMDYDENGIEDITIEITKSKTTLTPLVQDDQFLVKTHVTIEGNIVEYSGDQDLQFLSMDKMNETLATKVDENIRQVFTKAKDELKLDIFLFGEIFTHKYPHLLNLKSQEWNELFSNQLDLELSVEVKVKSTGTTIGKSL